MTSKDLLRELNNVDDNLIEEAADFVRGSQVAEGNEQKMQGKKFFANNGIFRIAGVAAAACLMICACWGISKINFGGGEVETGKHYYISGETVSGNTEMATDGELGLWFSTDELVYFGGHMYRTYSDGSGVTDQTIEETVYKKGKLLGKVEDSKEYGKSIYKDCPIYSLEGKKGTKQILVEHEEELLLFSLHEWLYEPDMAEMFRIYGIETAEDIQYVTVKYGPTDEFGWHNNSNVVSEQDKITELYSIMFSLVKDTSGYVDILRRISDADLQEWKESGGDQPQTGVEGETYIPGYRGTTAFDNSTDIVILSGDGEEITYSYYPKMGYLQQYKATDEIINWIAQNTN